MLKIPAKDKIQKEVEAILEHQAFKLNSPQEEKVREIIARVAAQGDRAVVDYTKKFDTKEFSLDKLIISRDEIEKAYQKIDKPFRDTLTKAIQNITAHHQKQRPDEWFETLPLDVVLGQRVIPLRRIGVYVPGGKACYPSSVLMGAIPAKVAGVNEIVMVSPPPIRPHVLVAAAEVGVTEIYQVGGAQAIAALAYGTKTIPRVDKIVGPGNIYVTLAKKLVFGLVGIDSLAGPSNVVIIADQDAEPEFVAADLLSQVEHDPDSFAVLITDSPKIAEKTEKQINKQTKQLSRNKIIEKAMIRIFLVENIKQAVEITNQLAPEHLELEIGSPQRLLEQIKNAGAVFLGPHSPVPVGDYIAGPNHVLPTGGTARFASPLSVYDFVKTQSIIGYTKPALKNVWKDIKLLAEIEGLDAHARSIDVRFS
ncbi:histidinol dehydrogenase [candidate division WOR-1 bacterium RIFCSPLOWO2_02_FULL_46_20]|uniref:Histidinol dehydrogenase n=2 Tax=Saganbacteria TaxID=1703751 RepID=A0A1F4RBJ6_UNCSA|nr:MAG: histidinol dehydrogenase [candidate division WOR-1 bacterium RIFCSPHIGHO2_02_FULL_45_12]OGC05538.1 MAG: histidinol dehydrogenase [candidate division WOR-1 bacterium RIFCSPLOWO2_02_FULL_46_20]OGC09178.1 MAG: histidinol dehydrogenase [candidate division WOR-1 bacterium RIFCSPLOWO2_12_FULL_45_9]